MYKQIFVSSFIALALIAVSAVLTPGLVPARAETAVCGNDIVEPPEECDGSPDCGTGCRLSTPTPACGNDIVEPGEECDGSPDCGTFCILKKVTFFFDNTFLILMSSIFSFKATESPTPDAAVAVD